MVCGESLYLTSYFIFLYFLFFFFKQKTAYEIKECDWSSDVCSSDLGIVLGTGETVIDDIFNWDDSSGQVFFSKNLGKNKLTFDEYKPIRSKLDFPSIIIHYDMLYDQIGRASCRERV